MTYKDKKRKTDHHVMGMADSMPQKKRKSANFLAIYHKVLKHERSLPPWVCLPFLTTFVLVRLPTLTTQVLHFICSLFYPISSRYLTIFVHFYVGFTLFIVLLYFIISQWFSFYNSTFFLWHAVSHSYNVMVSFAFFVFVRHTVHCFLLLVSCMLYSVEKHCPEEAHLNRWANRRLIVKIARRSYLSAWKIYILAWNLRFLY